MDDEHDERRRRELDALFMARDVERAFAGLHQANLISQKLSYESKLETCEEWLRNMPADHPRRREEEAQRDSLKAKLDELNRPPTIDRKRLAEAWKSVVKAGGSNIKARLGLRLIDPRNFRAWRAYKKFKDDSPGAIAIVNLLAEDLRAGGFDVARFGVRLR